MKFFQNLGKSIMLPVACMPLCGILMGIGYLMCPASVQVIIGMKVQAVADAAKQMLA